MIEIYRTNMTEEEIDHQIAYFSDPLTQQIVAKQPTIMQQSMAVGAAWGKKVSEKINSRLRDYKDG
jgi:hypothetical protein